MLNILIWLVDRAFGSAKAKIAALTPLDHQRAPRIQPEAPTDSAGPSLQKAGGPFRPCSREHPLDCNFLFQPPSLTCPAPVTLILSLCLSERMTWCIQEAEDTHRYQVPHTGQMISQLWGKRSLDPHTSLFCWVATGTDSAVQH